MAGVKIKVSTEEAQAAVKKLRQDLSQLGLTTEEVDNDVKKLESRLIKKVGADKAKSSIDSLTKSLGLSRNEVRRLEKEFGTAESTFTKIGRSAKSLGVQLGITFTALGAIGLGKKMFSLASDYESALIDMRKVTDASYADIRKTISTLGPELGTQTELMKGYYSIMSAGIKDPTKAYDMLKTASQVALSQHMEQQEVVKSLTSLMFGYGGAIKSAAEASDLLFAIDAAGKTSVAELVPVIGDLASISKQAGLNVDEMGAAMAVLSQTAGSTSQAATQLQAILVGLIRPQEMMAGLLKKMGVESGAALVQSVGFSKALMMVKQAAADAGVPIGKFFRSSEALIGLGPMLGSNMKEFDDRLGEIANKAGLAAQANKEFSGSAESASTTLKNTISGVMKDLGETFLPAVVAGMKDIQKYLSENKDAFKYFANSIIETWKGFPAGVLSGAAVGIIAFMFFGVAGTPALIIAGLVAVEMQLRNLGMGFTNLPEKITVARKSLDDLWASVKLQFADMPNIGAFGSDIAGEMSARKPIYDIKWNKWIADLKKSSADFQRDFAAIMESSKGMTVPLTTEELKSQYDKAKGIAENYYKELEANIKRNELEMREAGKTETEISRATLDAKSLNIDKYYEKEKMLITLEANARSDADKGKLSSAKFIADKTEVLDREIALKRKNLSNEELQNTLKIKDEEIKSSHAAGEAAVKGYKIIEEAQEKSIDERLKNIEAVKDMATEEADFAITENERAINKILVDQKKKIDDLNKLQESAEGIPYKEYMEAKRKINATTNAAIAEQERANAKKIADINYDAIKDIKGYEKEAYEARVAQINAEAKIALEAGGNATRIAQKVQKDTREAFIKMGKDGKDFFAGMKAGAAQMIADFKSVGTLGFEFMQDAFKALGDTVETFFSDLFKGELKSFGDYWDSFCDSLLAAFAKMIAQLIAQWLMFKATVALFGKDFASSLGLSGGGLGGLLGGSGGGLGGILGVVGSFIVNKVIGGVFGWVTDAIGLTGSGGLLSGLFGESVGTGGGIFGGSGGGGYISGIAEKLYSYMFGGTTYGGGGAVSLYSSGGAGWAAGEYAATMAAETATAYNQAFMAGAEYASTAYSSGYVLGSDIAGEMTAAKGASTTGAAASTAIVAAITLFMNWIHSRGYERYAEKEYYGEYGSGYYGAAAGRVGDPMTQLAGMQGDLAASVFGESSTVTRVLGGLATSAGYLTDSLSSLLSLDFGEFAKSGWKALTGGLFESRAGFGSGGKWTGPWSGQWGATPSAQNYGWQELPGSSGPAEMAGAMGSSLQNAIGNIYAGIAKGLEGTSPELRNLINKELSKQKVTFLKLVEGGVNPAGNIDITRDTVRDIDAMIKGVQSDMVGTYKDVLMNMTGAFKDITVTEDVAKYVEDAYTGEWNTIVEKVTKTTKDWVPYLESELKDLYPEIDEASIDDLLRLQGVIENIDTSNVAKALEDIAFVFSFDDSIAKMKDGVIDFNGAIESYYKSINPEIIKAQEEATKGANAAMTSLKPVFDYFIEDTKRLGLSAEEAKAALGEWIVTMMTGEPIITEFDIAAAGMFARWAEVEKIAVQWGYSAIEAGKLAVQGLQAEFAKLASGLTTTIEDDLRRLNMTADEYGNYLMNNLKVQWDDLQKISDPQEFAAAFLEWKQQAMSVWNQLSEDQKKAMGPQIIDWTNKSVAIFDKLVGAGTKFADDVNGTAGAFNPATATFQEAVGVFASAVGQFAGGGGGGNNNELPGGTGAHGGWVSGGIKGRDSVRALLMPGEFVVPADVAGSNSSTLELMRSRSKYARMAAGGFVGMAIGGFVGDPNPDYSRNVAEPSTTSQQTLADRIARERAEYRLTLMEFEWDHYISMAEEAYAKEIALMELSGASKFEISLKRLDNEEELYVKDYEKQKEFIQLTAELRSDDEREVLSDAEYIQRELIKLEQDKTLAFTQFANERDLIHKQEMKNHEDLLKQMEYERKEIEIANRLKQTQMEYETRTKEQIAQEGATGARAEHITMWNEALRYKAEYISAIELLNLQKQARTEDERKILSDEEWMNQQMYKLNAERDMKLYEFLQLTRRFKAQYGIQLDTDWASLLGFAGGGWVSGGVAGKDSVLSLLTPGEFVVPEKPAKEYAALLELIRSGRIYGAKDGIDFVPYDGMMVMAHKGEAFLTAEENRERKSESKKSSRGKEVNVTFNLTGTVIDRKAVDEFAKTIYPRLDRLRRLGH